MGVFLKHQSWRYNPGTLRIAMLVSLYLVMLFNQQFFASILSLHGIHGLKDYIFASTTVLLLLAITLPIVLLPGFRWSYKPWLVFILVSAAGASYFSNHYGVIFERTMLRNMLETDYAEAAELISADLLAYVALFGLLPAVAVIWVPIRYRTLAAELGLKLLGLSVSLVTIALIALVFYQDYASVLRSNRQLRNMIVPTGYLYASLSYAMDSLPSAHKELQSLGSDAALGGIWQSGKKPLVLIVVVGETARAQSFSLQGYQRPTNSRLQQQDIVYFPDFHSCGTATAVSVPCMFAKQGRSRFDLGESHYQENLLDVISHAGIPVWWRDNNSGCKGVCDRVQSESLSHTQDPRLCKDDECFDLILLQNLQEKMAGLTLGGLIVLHQKGSHGPAYYQRVPDHLKRFSPECRTSQLQECTPAEIINAYDNTIAYTDYFLSTLIDQLKSNQQDYDAGLIYVSDHGESLGEKGIFLHGLPYSIAPQQQTHVPFLLWFSQGFAQHIQIDRQCVAAQARLSLSHDNLFDTVLGLLDIKTRDYTPERDIFAGCMQRQVMG